MWSGTSLNQCFDVYYVHLPAAFKTSLRTGKLECDTLTLTLIQLSFTLPTLTLKGDVVRVMG